MAMSKNRATESRENLESRKSKKLIKTSILGLENMLASQNSMPDAFGQGTIDTGDFIWDETFVAGYEDPAKEADTGSYGVVDSFAASNDMGQVSQAWGDAGAPRLLSPDCELWFASLGRKTW